MEVLALWRLVRRRWWLILLPTALAFLLLLPSLPNVLASTQNYSVAMRFTAAAPSTVAADSDSSYEDSVYVPWLASEYVVVNLPQWVTSDSFAREVSASLAHSGIAIEADDLRPAFVADSARSILVVYITWDKEDEIKAIAEAAVDVLQTRNQTYFPQFAAHPADVIPLDEVRVNAVPVPLMTRFGPFLRLIIAFGAGIGLAVLAEYFDNTVRDEEDLGALEVKVLGSVPPE